MINIYRVGSLNGNCLGEVSAIEYCYQYTVSGQGEAVFNWTVLILDNLLSGTDLRITHLYTIDSRPDSLDDGACQNANGGAKRRCCDVEHISGFNLSVDFVFGVTESARGNTHSATLLGYHESGQPEYLVGTQLQNKMGLSLLVSSTVPGNALSQQRGLRMLWFVIGKLNVCTSKLNALFHLSKHKEKQV